jgi:hypothetical protein
MANVYHGLPRDLYPFSREPKGDYLAFIGRLCPEKGPDDAIAIARQSGMQLRIAGNVKQEDRSYFEKCIAPHLDGSSVVYIGEVNDKEKAQLLADARALLFPIHWPEPFGLVLIEAMACGTPIIAYRDGSVSEVVEPGITGFVVETAKQAASAVDLLPTIDRAKVRRRFEERFSLERMVGDYFSIYRARIESQCQRKAQCNIRGVQASDLSSRIEISRRELLPGRKRSITRRLWIRMEFESGKSYARDRARDWSCKKRLLYLGCAPLIPLVRSVRILKQLAQSRIRRELGFWNTLWAPLGLISSALGEAAGYTISLRGPISNPRFLG